MLFIDSQPFNLDVLPADALSWDRKDTSLDAENSSSVKCLLSCFDRIQW